MNIRDKGHNFAFKMSMFRGGFVIACSRMTTHECIKSGPPGRSSSSLGPPIKLASSENNCGNKDSYKEEYGIYLR